MHVVSQAEAAKHLRGLGDEEPRIVASGNFATPWELVALAEHNLERVRAFVLNPQLGWPRRLGFITETPFVGPGVRQDDYLDYLPMRLSLVPRLFGSVRPPDAVLLHCSPPRDAKVSLGIEVNILPAAIDNVRRGGGLVIAQINPHMPYTRGDAEIDVDSVDFAIEVDTPLPSPVPRDLDDEALAIGERVAALASDGCTLQMGIGQLPDAALAHMQGQRSMGVWSELVSDGVLQLERTGALNPQRTITATFAFGTPELYAWMHDNPRLSMRRTEIVNDPSHISAQPAMLSINTAVEVDLYAQANASYVRGSIYSGFGGQPDFVVGALHSEGGHAVLCLRSWHAASDSSSIVPILHQPVCSFQHSSVITEQGRAEIFGRSQHAQARLLIEAAAHPRAREDLRKAAVSLGLTRASH